MNKYPSKYSNGKEVSAAQFISELVCERIAKKNKKDLHYRFWLSEEWQKEFKGQITTAYKLLKKYDPKAIIQALKSDAGQKIYSLRAPHLSDMIERAQKQIDSQPVIEPKIIQRNLLDKGKQTTKTNSLIDKLKELE